MIPREIFTSFAEFQGIISVNDIRIPVRLQELLQSPLGFMWSFGFARIRLDPLCGQILHHECISMIVSRLASVAQDPVICCEQVTEIYSSRYGFAIASSAWVPCNFGPFTDLAISVFREMSMNTVITQILTCLCSRLLRSFTNGMGHLHWSDVTVNAIFSSSILNFTYCWWRRWGWGRWWRMTLLSWRCLWSWWRSRRRTWQAWNYNRNEVFRIAHYPSPVFSEMWFLTIDL